MLKGRTFNVPKKGIRPTTERTREAVFSSLAAIVPGARVLDLFAGAGGLGLEAWSRGAQSVVSVEKNRTVYYNLKGNFERLGGEELGRWEVVQADVYSYLRRSFGTFDLIFADPPYDEADLPRLLSCLQNRLEPEGFLVFEMRKNDPYTLPPEWILHKEKKYGSTRIVFLEQNNE